MEEKLKNELNKDEKLLWSASPEAFETMDKTNKSAIVKRIIIAAVICVALCVAYIVFCISGGTKIKVVLPLIILVAGVCTAINGVLDASKLAKNTLYAVTDKRLIVVFPDTAKSVSYDVITKACFKEDEDGHSSLLVGGKACDSKPATWRNACLSGARCDNSTGICESFAFYAVPDAKELKKLLSEYVSF